MSGVSRRAMALISSNGRSTTGQMYSMHAVPVEPRQLGVGGPGAADRVEAAGERQLDLGDRHGPAALVAHWRSGRGSRRRRRGDGRPGCPWRRSRRRTRRRPTAGGRSRSWTTATSAAVGRSSGAGRGTCGPRRSAVARRLQSAAGIQYGASPSSSGRRNVNGSVATAGSGWIAITATRRIAARQRRRRRDRSPAHRRARRSARVLVAMAPSGRGRRPRCLAARRDAAARRRPRARRRAGASPTRTASDGDRAVVAPVLRCETTSNPPIRSIVIGPRSRIL